MSANYSGTTTLDFYKPVYYESGSEKWVLERAHPLEDLNCMGNKNIIKPNSRSFPITAMGTIGVPTVGEY